MELLAVIGLLSIIMSITYIPISLAKRHYLRKLCKYQGPGEKPGRACVICCYHHKCPWAKKSIEYVQYSYWRRMIPDRGKKLFDEIWDEQNAKPNK